MTDLTEQWKKGELPEGWYFVILNNGKVNIAKCSNLFINCGRKLKRNFAINNVAEVIEPICYEKWQAVNQNMDSVMQTNQALCKKLAELKELLKECREEIASVEWDSVANDRNQMKLLTKIDEVLK
jgi:hypothetical protein